MSTESTLFALCELSTAIKYDILDYPIQYYDGIPMNNTILVRITESTVTRQQYQDLCDTMGLEAFSPGDMEITKVTLENTMWFAIEFCEVHELVNKLLDEGARIFLYVSF